MTEAETETETKTVLQKASVLTALLQGGLSTLRRKHESPQRRSRRPRAIVDIPVNIVENKPSPRLCRREGGRQLTILEIEQKISLETMRNPYR